MAWYDFLSKRVGKGRREKTDLISAVKKNVAQNKVLTQSDVEAAATFVPIKFLATGIESGEKNLSVIKKMQNRMALTDNAKVLGGWADDIRFSGEGFSIADRAGIVWSESPDDSTRVRVLHSGGSWHCYDCSWRSVASAPASLFSDISLIPPNVVRGRDGILRFTQGEYPQEIADKAISERFFKKHRGSLSFSPQNGQMDFSILKLTGRGFTFDTRKYNDCNLEFAPERYPEFEFEGEKYILSPAHSSSSEAKLSDGTVVKGGDYILRKVSPIVHILNDEQDENGNYISFPEKATFAGIQFDPITSEYEASAIKIYNELRYAVECTKDQIAPAVYVLGEKYKRVPANAFNGIQGLQRVVLQSVLEIGSGAFAGFGFIAKQKDGTLAIAKERTPDAVWEMEIGDKELIHIATGVGTLPTLFVKNKYGSVDILSENGEKRNICDVAVFEKLKKQDLTGALNSWETLRDEYKSKSPLYFEVMLATGGDTGLYKKFFESKVTGFDQLIKREWYPALSDESKEDIMKLFISLGGFEKTGQKDVLIAIDKLQEAYGQNFNNELHHLFMDVPKGETHLYGKKRGRDDDTPFHKTILNFFNNFDKNRFRDHKEYFSSEEFKLTISSLIANPVKIYNAYRDNLREHNPDYTYARQPDLNTYKKLEKEGLTASFVLAFLASEKYIYLNNEDLRQRLAYFPRGLTVDEKAAREYERILDIDVPKIITDVRSGKRERNKYFVNQIDDGREIQDNNPSGIRYEWAEINRTNALTCGERMKTCFRLLNYNRFAFYSCIDNPEDTFMMLYDGDRQCGYCRVRYYPDKKGIMVDNIELSHAPGETFSDAKRKEFAERCKKGLLDMAEGMNGKGVPVERIYAKQNSWADKVILDEWNKQHDTVDKIKGVSSMQEVTYTSPRESGSYSAGNVGPQIVLMEKGALRLKSEQGGRSL